ncbi:precorrin-6Y C5,15-methyltransferase (decarboxylating) subunit CbiT [Inediibacterium massiliense]|uniref:precorrin-6Y C5,15-methyltransferase (decarboxylating) subunit CbiT n=1 Tax=Inediibacterium massiliense TaxID=1658111 RepID=UPI0006B550E2|nr:precorrin-6Y C5,15-methyltransferase (decarboxylating) subunit CbiT [Inediibacterium massiliense]
MNWKFKTPGIPDEYFIRGKVPMTKEEVRALTISKLRLKEDLVMVDIGAGTGSISIESAHICKKVIAIERNPEGIELIKKNSEKFNVPIQIIHNNGKDALKQINTFDRAFIGGSGGELEDIIKLCYEKLTDQGICVINCITIETLYKSMELLKATGFKDIDVISINISKGRALGKYTLMEALNPIYVISARKQKEEI